MDEDTAKSTVTAPAPGPSTGRIDSLDALRGLLAVSVMGYHLLIYRYDFHLIGLGDYAVYTFFALSGFAITWVSSKYTVDRFPMRDFYVARGARILPLWWVAVLGTVASALPTLPAMGKLMENLTMLFALTPTSDIPAGGWSIEIEVVFYLLFPLLLLMLPSVRSRVVFLVVALAIRFIYVRTAFHGAAVEPDTVIYQQIPSFLVFFVGGMLAAELRRVRTAVRSQWPFFAGLAILALVFLTSARHVGKELLPFTQRQIVAGPLSMVLVLACVGAVFLVSFAPNPRGRVGRKVQATLGSISYSIYLLHPLVYTAVHKLRLGNVPTIGATVVLSFAASWCSYKYFEAPARQWIRRRLARPVTPAPVA